MQNFLRLEHFIQDRSLFVEAEIYSAAANVKITIPIELTLTESFGLRFSFEIQNSIAEVDRLFRSEDVVAILPSLDFSFPALLLSFTPKFDGHISAAATEISRRSPSEFDCGIAGARGKAHLLNGPELIFFRSGDFVKPYQWKADGVDFKFYENKTVDDRGHSITHALEFSGTDLDIKKLKRIYGYLQSLFSFMKGVDVGIFNIHTKLPDGKLCNALVGAGSCATWQPANGWLDRSMFKYIAEIAERYSDIYFNSLYQKPLRRFLEFYKIGNLKTSRPWNSIIVAQAAVEALGFSILQSLGGYSKSKIKDLNKADFLRATCRTIGLRESPIENCESLKALMNKYGWTDGEETLVKIRNDLTHEGNLDLEGIALIEASASFLWLGEMMVLALLGYKGEYFDRRVRTQWKGTLKPVPL